MLNFHTRHPKQVALLSFRERFQLSPSSSNRSQIGQEMTAIIVAKEQQTTRGTYVNLAEATMLDISLHP